MQSTQTSEVGCNVASFPGSAQLTVACNTAGPAKLSVTCSILSVACTTLHVLQAMEAGQGLGTRLVAMYMHVYSLKNVIYINIMHLLVAVELADQ